MRIKSASDIKYKHLELIPDSHFFDRATFKFFGDSMKNFGVWNDKARGRIIMYRKKPVKHGLSGRWLFDPVTGALSTLRENDE